MTKITEAQITELKALAKKGRENEKTNPSKKSLPDNFTELLVESLNKSY